MLLDDIALHLTRRLPALCPELSAQLSIQNIIVDEDKKTVTIQSSTPITKIDDDGRKKSLKVGDGINIQGIRYLYPISSITRPIKEGYLRNNFVAVTSSNHRLIGGLTRQVEIYGVTSQPLLNGTWPILSVKTNTNIFSFKLPNSLNISEQSIINEGYYGFEWFDNEDICCALNGYKRVIEIVDEYSFKFSIDVTDPYNSIFLSKDVGGNMPALTGQYDFSKAALITDMRIYTAVSLERAHEVMNTNFLGDKVHLVVHPNSGIEFANQNGITNNSPTVIQGHGREYRSQIMASFGITITKVLTDSGMCGEWADYAQQFLQKLLVSIAGSEIPSMFGENNYRYFEVLATACPEPVYDKPFAWQEYYFKVVTFINTQDVYRPSLNLPLQSFDIDNYTLDGLNKITADSNLY